VCDSHGASCLADKASTHLKNTLTKVCVYGPGKFAYPSHMETNAKWKIKVAVALWEPQSTYSFKEHIYWPTIDPRHCNLQLFIFHFLRSKINYYLLGVDSQSEMWNNLWIFHSGQINEIVSGFNINSSLVTSELLIKHWIHWNQNYADI